MKWLLQKEKEKLMIARRGLVARRRDGGKKEWGQWNRTCQDKKGGLME